MSAPQRSEYRRVPILATHAPVGAPHDDPNSRRLARPRPEFEYGRVQPASFGWAVLGRVAVQAVQIATMVVLARFLVPAQFGIYAAAAVVIALAQIFTDLGIGPAVVHRDPLSRQFLQSAFWLNAVSGVVLSLLALAIAWPMSRWYHYPQLTWVIPLAGLSFTVSLSTVGLAVLERQFRFRTIALSEFAAASLGSGSMIVIAVLHPSVFALAVGPVITAAALSVIVYVVGDWRPSLTTGADRRSLRALRGYSGFVSLFNLATYAARNSDDLFLGRYVSAASLGFYSRGYQLMLLPVQQVTAALARTLQPSYAAVRSDLGELQRRYAWAEISAAAIGFPATAIMCGLAPSAVPVVMGHQWDPMVSLFQILSLSIPAQVIVSVNGPLYTATGQVRLLLASGLCSSGLLVVAFYLAAPHGATVVAVVFLAHSVLTAPISLVPIVRRLRLRFAPVVPPLLALAALSAALFAALYYLPSAAGLTGNGPARLLAQLALLLVIGLIGYRVAGHAGIVPAGAPWRPASGGTRRRGYAGSHRQ